MEVILVCVLAMILPVLIDRGKINPETVIKFGIFALKALPYVASLNAGLVFFKWISSVRLPPDSVDYEILSYLGILEGVDDFEWLCIRIALSVLFSVFILVFIRVVTQDKNNKG